jgi:phosphate starvation-inducible protein PhoH
MAKKRKSLSGVGLTLRTVTPLTENQALAFNSTKHMVLHGVAGTGKTYLASYLAYKGMTDLTVSQFVIIRSAVPTRDMGFLPGTEKEKSAVYEEPYKDIAIDVFDRGDAYEILKQKGLVQFMTTSFIRGITLRDSFILIDECQNMSFQELDSIITRMGENCKVIFCGDFRQADLAKNGLDKFIEVLNHMDLFDLVEFGIDDIVRSDLVKSYIIAKYKVES